MGGWIAQPLMTPSRLAWLLKLQSAPFKREGGRTGNDCAQLGWTERLYQRGDQMAGAGALLKAHGDLASIRLAGWRHAGFDGLTDLGRAALLEPDEVIQVRKKLIRQEYQRTYGERRLGDKRSWMDA